MSKKDLPTLTAADLMQRDVIAVHLGDSLREAMSLMVENHVTGLPVMDRRSRCVGLITASDILNYEQENASINEDANEDMARHFDPDTQRWESVRATAFGLEEFADVPVDEVMARELVWVERELPVSQVAQVMVKNSVHRVLVMNSDKALYGIISSIDFVKLFAEL